MKKNESPTLKQIQEENIAAQRSAAESIAISRATLEQALCQGEQLENVDKMQERQKYIVEKSGRIVRGMTWSGWMMNVFSKDVSPTLNKATSDAMKQQSSISREAVSHALVESDTKDIPPELWNQACMLQNLECNILLLEKCQSKEEFDTLLEICKSLNTAVKNSLVDAADSHRRGSDKLSTRSYQKLKNLESKFEQVEDLQYTVVRNVTNKFAGKVNARDELFHSNSNSFPSGSAWLKTDDSKIQKRIDEQDEHLNILGKNIQELLHNGASIGTSLDQQNQLLEKLDAGADDIKERTKMVTRRADRLSHRSLWRSPKSDFKFSVTIQHLSTNKYLSIDPKEKNKIFLHDDLHPDLSVFDVHERRGSHLVGFMNRCTKTWLGQSTLGYFSCHAKKFGRNEEWEFDDAESMARTKLLCACAAWGNGGWLKLNETNHSFSFVEYTSESKQLASNWSIVVIREN